MCACQLGVLGNLVLCRLTHLSTELLLLLLLTVRYLVCFTVCQWFDPVGSASVSDKHYQFMRVSSVHRIVLILWDKAFDRLWSCRIQVVPEKDHKTIAVFGCCCSFGVPVYCSELNESICPGTFRKQNSIIKRKLTRMALTGVHCFDKALNVSKILQLLNKCSYNTCSPC